MLRQRRRKSGRMGVEKNIKKKNSAMKRSIWGLYIMYINGIAE